LEKLISLDSRESVPARTLPKQPISVEAEPVSV
jgi:hypothetical protein